MSLPFGSDPFRTAISESLALPDGYGFLDLIYDLPAGIECLSTLRARDGYDNGDFAYLEITDAMNRRNCVDRILSYGFLDNLT